MSAKETAPVSISAAGLTPGRYALEVYHVGYASNDAYTEYVKMGAPSNFSRVQAKELQKNNAGEPVLTREIASARMGIFPTALT